MIRTKEQVLSEKAAELRSVAFELECIADDPSHLPPPPPRFSLQAMREKRVSAVAAGGWAAVLALVIELLRVTLEHVR
jgi:hypothetical protein